MTRATHRLVVTIKPGVRIAAVVEHAVQNQAHSFFLRVFPQTQQRHHRQTAHQRGDNLRYRIYARLVL
jgi:hypothetical protein